MNVIFYVASIAAIFASIKVISSTRVDKAILYLIISLSASSLIFIQLDAYFSAALSVILLICGVAILFLYVASFLKIKIDSVETSQRGISPRIWLGPLVLAFMLLVMLIYGIVSTDYTEITDNHELKSEMSLNAYILVAELAGFLLLGTLVIAYHFMRRLFREVRR